MPILLLVSRQFLKSLSARHSEIWIHNSAGSFGSFIPLILWLTYYVRAMKATSIRINRRDRKLLELKQVSLYSANFLETYLCGRFREQLYQPVICPALHLVIRAGKRARAWQPVLRELKSVPTTRLTRNILP
jgi:hypothetical protein